MAQFCLLAFALLLLEFLSPIITGVAYALPTFTLVNSCQDTIWPAISPTAGNSQLSTTGFALHAGESKTIQAQASWGGRFWARTYCNQSSRNFSCLTGDCGTGKVECAGSTGAPPATVAEFQVGGFGGLGFYVVSLVGGFNLPVLVSPLVTGNKCLTTGCAADLIRACPSELKVTGDGGKIVGCNSACDAFKTDEYCCTGSGACEPTSYSQYFKSLCPNAYSKDNQTRSFSCPGSVYIITFCPASNNSQVESYFPVNATSTMKVADQLIYPSQLVSEGGNFTLGFFTLNNTDFSYLGIWHTADEQRRKVWIANPNSPITMINSQVKLLMDGTGTLRILKGQSPIMNVAADQVKTSNVTIAVLQDSGNFVLVDSGAQNQILWQSFDNPTSMLLPGMKLGYNLTTRQNWTLTSWLNLYVASSGAFTWSLERVQGSDSGQFVIRRHGRIYWTSGHWKDQGFRYFPSLSAHSAQFRQKLNFISGNDGMYFTFETSGASLSMLELSPEGQIVDHDANGGLIVSPYQDFCYGYERDNGCATSEFPDCRGKDKFQMQSGYFVGNSSFSYDANSNISLSDCMERCWTNCRCNGFASNSNDTGCTIWTGNQQFQVDQSGRTERIYLLHPAVSSSSQGRAWIWILVAIAIALPLLLGFICYIRIRKRRKKEKRLQNYIHQLTESVGFENVDEMSKTGKEGHGLKIFSIGSVMTATSTFSRENKLGEGGFGPVYKGKLLDGREIAVKRLSRTSTQGLKEFKNELKLIFKLQHTNLVQLLGCCMHEEEKMLIYEYMPNKSLDCFLFAQDKEDLDWQKRFNIIEGVAQGLLYLHKYSRMRVIHRDLKASNILLDENMNPKIADFGLARMFKQNETEAVTNIVVGTYGYMSPEYAMGGTFSIKSDVFSFGVLVLEIISGRKNSSFYQFEDYSVNLVGYAWDLWKRGDALELKDTVLGDSFDAKQLLTSIQVGLLCVQESATNRPTMTEVISMLTNKSITLPAPMKPAFFTGRSELNLESTSSERGNQGIVVSVNDCSISVIEPR